MKKKMIMLGTVFAVFLMLMIPCVNALNTQTIKICTTPRRLTPFLSNYPNYRLVEIKKLPRYYSMKNINFGS